MPVTGEELVTLLIALVATALVVFGIRRALMRSALPDGKTSGRGKLTEGESKISESETKSEAGTQKADAPATGTDEDDESEASDEQDDEARRLGEGLAKTRSTGFVSRLGKLFARKKIDDSLLEELEEVLFTADIGPKTANRLLGVIKNELSKTELDDPSVVWKMLQEESVKILDIEAPVIDYSSQSPFVLLVLGVNGAGKTTTIGKLAAKLQGEGKKVLLAAGDTFRAAAVEQLQVWGERAGATVIRGKDGQDPSSVIFEAIKRGQEEDYDVVICDTAGRLHTKVELMEELKKVGRVCEKAMPGCPHETWLVLDSTTGQNAIQQAVHFKAAMNITGIVLTKLDGTAKGGVVLGISDEMGVPIRYIGIGEQVDDLRPFAPESFVAALYQDSPHTTGAEDHGS
jgi:fused signal recognition particle receptor